MIKLKSLIKESYISESFEDDYFKIYDEMRADFYSGQKYQTWKLIPSKDLLILWATFAKYGRVDEKKLNGIWEIIKENVIKIGINTDVWNGKEPEFFYKDEYDEITEQEWERHALFISDRSNSQYVRSFSEMGGNARYSDCYKSLYKLLEKCYSVSTSEELLISIDTILNFVHGLGPMAKWFVEGGTDTLNKNRDFQTKGIHLTGKLSENDNRKVGKSLPETGYKYKYVEIYRAMLGTEKELKPNDYVTRSKRFAVEHADHMTTVNDETYHVMKYMVKAENVFEAYNPGEYFYNGPSVKGNEIYKSENFLQESFHTSFEATVGYKPVYVEVFKNPSFRELKECNSGGYIGVILFKTDVYTWNRNKAFHSNVMRHLNLGNEMLPLLVILENGNMNNVDILVTDASRHTKWSHNPDIEDFIEKHPFFKNKQIDTISYWDEDIVGDWSKL